MAKKYLKVQSAIALSVLLSGCATNTSGPAKNDPLEPLNRGVYQVNKVADRLFISPAALVYKLVAPPPLRSGITNLFYNIGEVPTMANNLLQGSPKDFSISFARILINTTLGIGGIFDIATEMGVTRRYTDLGYTLQQWGYDSSAYLVLPIIGPSTIRDTIGLIGNSYASLPTYLDPAFRNAYQGAYYINTKVLHLRTQNLVESAGVDEYSLVKTGYFQHRAYENRKASEDGEGLKPNSELLGEPPE